MPETIITAAEVREGETVVSLRRVPRPPEDRWELRLGQRQVGVVKGWEAAVSTANRIADDIEALRKERVAKVAAALADEPVHSGRPDKTPVRKGI